MPRFPLSLVVFSLKEQSMPLFLVSPFPSRSGNSNNFDSFCYGPVCFPQISRKSHSPSSFIASHSQSLTCELSYIILIFSPSTMGRIHSYTNIGILSLLPLATLARATWNNSTSDTTQIAYPTYSEYSTKVYNVSAATTTITYHYSNEELALLWDQIGPISTGIITTTVSPTPEPSAYPRPGGFHPQVIMAMYISTSANCKRSQAMIHHSRASNYLMTLFGVWLTVPTRSKVQLRMRAKVLLFGI